MSSFGSFLRLSRLLSLCNVFQEGDNGIVRIDAGRYCDSYGVLVSDRSTSEGHFSSVVDLDAGDWMSWDIELEEDGPYWLSYRINSPEGDGWLELTGTGPQEVSVSVDRAIPATLGEWKTIRQRVDLKQGRQSLLMTIIEGGWSLQWVELKRAFEEQGGTFESRAVSLPSDFIQVHGQEILAPDGSPLLLQGMGLGGWMLQEPYMMLSNSAIAQWQMFEQIADLVGPHLLKRYRKAWLDNWMTKEDVQELKESGFNSMRVPLHYNLFTLPIEEEPVQGEDTWLEDGFERIDQLLEWCEKEEIYMILDLHAAPGGQGRDAKISDYDASKPSLWENEENIRKSVALWRKLAERYATKTWIAGYDLLNEPNWDFEGSGDINGCNNEHNLPLKDFYDQVIRAIREVDTNHVLFIEGNCWANNHAGLWPVNDDKAVLSFHRYWVDNAQQTIENYLNLSDEYHVPLWMGESGENHNFWYHEAVMLLEKHNIGWSWWTWKKMQSPSGSFAIYPPEEYSELLEYWNDPSAATTPLRHIAYRALMKVAESAKIENTHRNAASIEALTGYIRSCSEVGYVPIVGTTRLEAEDFCSMSGIATEETRDIGGGQNVGWFHNEAWTAHNIEVTEAGLFEVHFRVASLDGDGAFVVELESDGGKLLGEITSVPDTGDWQEWTTIQGLVELPVGAYSIVIKSTHPGWNLNWFEFERIVE